ncbi:MAG TPA: DegT/DnrJ/EryC1/StrS family aminotransferase [Terriglobales bacterium]|nr:DegT/DnrJ/EryC1/StrS family aminotransferase [Terriglobales bacterium]
MRTTSTKAERKLMQVPLLDLRRQYAQVREEIVRALERVCDSQQFILGPEVAEFEKEVSAYLGVQHTVGCASGTEALWLALVAAGVQPGDSVITTPFSFFASASSIVRAGARPVFVDVDARTLNLDPAQVTARLKSTSNLRAILPVHLYGQCADMDAFLNIAAEGKLALIEDAAQAFGAGWLGKRAGSLGSAAAFSFYPTKNLSAAGEAGCVTTQDAGAAERMRSLRNHGSRERYFHDEIGWNSRLDGMQAAVLRVKMKYLEEWNQQRRARAGTYDSLFTSAGLRQSNGNDPQSPVQFLECLPQAQHIYHQYVIRAQRRDELKKFLGAAGIGAEVYYPLPLHRQKCFAYLGYCEGDLPEAERAAREVLALPMFPELSEEEQSYVVETVAEFYS